MFLPKSKMGLCLAVLIFLSGRTVFTEEVGKNQTGVKSAEQIVSKPDKTAPEPAGLGKKIPGWLNHYAFADEMDGKSSREKLRSQWKNLLGVDIFLPYFKAKEMETWVKEKAQTSFFKMKGEPEFNTNRLDYIFKVKF